MIGPPFFKRQVNEYWLGRYRVWVYGSGFGWQIGAGVTTYIMTAAVFLTIALGVLTAGPWAALVVGVVFGLARGLAVLLTARLRTTAEVFALHRRFDALGEPVRLRLSPCNSRLQWSQSEQRGARAQAWSPPRSSRSWGWRRLLAGGSARTPLPDGSAGR